jgi:hypothetical protein
MDGVAVGAIGASEREVPAFSKKQQCVIRNYPGRLLKVNETGIFWPMSAVGGGRGVALTGGSESRW